MNLDTLFALAALLICLGEVHNIFLDYVPLKFWGYPDFNV